MSSDFQCIFPQYSLSQRRMRTFQTGSEAYKNRGDTYCKGHEYELAIKDYEKAIRLKPDYAEAYKNRGDAYCKRHEYELAIEDYEEAIRLKPDYTLATCDLCEALLAEHEWEQRNQI